MHTSNIQLLMLDSHTMIFANHGKTASTYDPTNKNVSAGTGIDTTPAS